MCFKTIAALTASLTLHATAQASVIYEWIALNHEAPRGITLRLEFDDAVYKAGSFSFHVAPEQPGLPRPDSGLLFLSYSFPGAYNPMTYSPRTEAFRSGLGLLDMEINFEPGGFLTGFISANNAEHDFSIVSQGRVFTLSAHSDQGMVSAGCTDSIWGCAGATGQMRYVPEPGSLALLTVGLLGVIGASRGRRLAS